MGNARNRINGNKKNVEPKEVNTIKTLILHLGSELADRKYIWPDKIKTAFNKAVSLLDKNLLTS